MNKSLLSFLPLLAVTACEPTELATPVPLGCDDSTADNAWPQFDGEQPAVLETGFNVGDVAPDFKLLDQNGDEVCLWQFRGKVVLLDASALWCGPCKDIAKHTSCVADSYNDELVYLTFITQNDDQQPAATEDAAYWSDTYGLGEGSLTPVIADGNSAFVREAEWVPSYPSFLLLDRDMTIAEKSTGRQGEADVRTKATELLGPPTSTCLD